MLRYAILDAATPPRHAARLATLGVDYLQLRAKHIAAGEILTVGRRILAEIVGTPTQLLINARPDAALALAKSTGQSVGVHLTSHPDELSPSHIRTLFAASSLLPPLSSTPCISVSCHTPAEVAAAHAQGADLILFGPVFEKRVARQFIHDGSGLALLRKAVAAAGGTPVLALGGITEENTPDCLGAGAAGIAAIRLFA